MKTQDQIVEYYEKQQHSDMFGFVGQIILPFLDFEHAKPFLKDEATPESWGEAKPLTRETVIEEMRDYMTFALGKARDHRGLSAGRSIEKFMSWLWLLEDEETYERGKYTQYGVPILRKICEVYEFEMPTSAQWFENMSQGKPCREGCNEGCGI